MSRIPHAPARDELRTVCWRYDDEVDSQAASGPRIGRAGDGHQRSSGAKPGTKPLKHASANLHLNFPFENIDNRMRIMPVDLVDGSWGVIDSNDFDFFTRCSR
jgi:hypothetical protein